LERMKVKKPNQPPYSTKLPEYYSYKDLHVGAVIVLNNFYFKLFDADEYCLKFMEKNSNMFEYSNVNSVFRKVQSMLQTDQINNLGNLLTQSDTFNAGYTGLSSFFGAIANVTGKNLKRSLFYLLKFFLNFYSFKKAII
jgi:hypothetical protein